ncbi:glycoside hydrolase family 16 protein [Suillus clintonianus]|uniref:glycoside hydrolase family 16 protein n=1 Tax=Suillus clintonianus TaxID=1904413 RepID=UPI001B870A53|nr:glycoside hydrolase family 16 protein [Suillus clintonianus]KAG2153377.1 glycoside hydrolase family 16 protein [Suillus clintonianus]
MKTVSSALTLASLVGSALASAIYTLSESVRGEGFYDSFNFENITDPTHGRVTYVSRKTAERLNLTYATSDTFILRADDTTVLSANDSGRNSVRIRSNHQYTEHVVVFDIQHIPEGCGTWPAIWETKESDWPASGEIDILEGANNVVPNQATLHTGHNCSMPNNTLQSGTTMTTNCDASVAYNVGCAVKLTEDDNSFGPGFNRIGGGWYAMERTLHYIKVWFWERYDPTVPFDITSGAWIIDTANWGIPAANFPNNTECDIKSHFGSNNIIIDLTFCESCIVLEWSATLIPHIGGDWAGNAALYNASGCPSDCVSYVNNNPSAFTNAYFQISSMNIYE